MRHYRASSGICKPTCAKSRPYACTRLVQFLGDRQVQPPGALDYRNDVSSGNLRADFDVVDCLRPDCTCGAACWRPVRAARFENRKPAPGIPGFLTTPPVVSTPPAAVKSDHKSNSLSATARGAAWYRPASSGNRASSTPCAADLICRSHCAVRVPTSAGCIR